MPELRFSSLRCCHQSTNSPMHSTKSCYGIMCVRTLVGEMAENFSCEKCSTSQGVTSECNDVANLSYPIRIYFVYTKCRAFVYVYRVCHVYLDYLPSPPSLSIIALLLSFLSSLPWHDNCKISTSSEALDYTTIRACSRQKISFFPLLIF